MAVVVRRQHVVVVGGGITGCAAAYFASRLRADVTLVDKADLNTQASGRNAGGLHGQIQYEPFVELGDGWAREFAPALELLRDSIRLWRQLERELGVDLEVVVSGGLMVAATATELAVLERKASIERAVGSEVELLDRSDLLRLAPYISPRMAGALLCHLEGKANPLLAAPALARAAAERGARILLCTEVHGLEPTAGGFRVETTAGSLACDAVVAAAGVDVGRLPAFLGIELKVEPHPIQVAVTEAVPPLVPHLVYLAGGRVTLKQARYGSLLIGGGWPARQDVGDGLLAVDVGGLGENLRRAVEVVPSTAGALLLRTWAGVCPGLPDHKPLIGEVVPGLVVALFPFLGFGAGPIMGRLAAALALGEAPSYDLRPFAPVRHLGVAPAREAPQRGRPTAA